MNENVEVIDSCQKARSSGEGFSSVRAAYLNLKRMRDQAQQEDEPRANNSSKLRPRKKGPHYSQLMIGVQSARLDGGWCQDDMHP